MEERAESSTRLLMLISAGVAVVAAAILFFFDPSRYGFYPHCIFHQVTGYLCPGCGGLRAIHQLLHGNLAGAWHFNALLVASLPLLSFYGLCRLWRHCFCLQALGEFRLVWLWGALAVIFIFGILRNFMQ